MNWFEEGYRQLTQKVYTIPTKLPKLYLSGQMSGLPDHGFPLFNTTAAKLRARGYEVINPAENGSDKTWEEYMKTDLINMLQCDGVAVLPNWRNSRGARLETYVAGEVKLPIWSAETMQLLPEESILEEASRLVNGDRQQSYGHPYYDYLCATTMFNAWMDKKYGAGKWHALAPEDGIIFQVCVKLSREGNSPKRDNRTDAGGYLLCYDKTLKKIEELNGQ